MKNKFPLYNFLRTRETTVYTWLCVGFVYSMIGWTLLNSLFCIAISAYWLFFSSKRFDLKSNSTKLLILFSCLYLVFMAGMLYTSNRGEGLFRLQQRSAMLLFPLVFGTTSVLTPKFVNNILRHLTAASLIACAISLASGFIKFLHTGNPDMLTYERLLIFRDTYMYFMGLCCLISLSFLLYSWQFSSPAKKRWIIAGFVLLSAYIFLLSVRMLVFCWLLVILFFLFKYETSVRQRILTTLALVAVLIVSFLTIPALQRQWRELADPKGMIPLGQDASLGRSWGGKAIRVAIWECSSQLAVRHWAAGVGTGDVQDSLQQSYEDAKFYFASRYNRYNAHNQYLQLVIGNGAGSLLIYLLCLFVPPVLLRGHPYYSIYLLMLIMIAIVSLSEVVFDINKGIVLYSFFNSIFAFTNYKNPGS